MLITVKLTENKLIRNTYNMLLYVKCYTIRKFGSALPNKTEVKSVLKTLKALPQKSKWSFILRLILVFIISTSSLMSRSQDSHIRFKRITINDGLSMSSVYCIFQDSKGFMWFGTEDGLNKYDGNNFRIYRAKPYDNNSISHKWTEIFFEDNSGMLWLGSRGGLTRFDPASGQFIQFVHDVSNPASLANDTVTTVIEDDNKRIWIGTLGGLNYFEKEMGQFERASFSRNDESGGFGRINTLLLDESGRLWIGGEQGLIFWDAVTETFSKIPLAIPGHKDAAIHDMAIQDDILWLGTDKGLLKYHLINGSQEYLSWSNEEGTPIDNQIIETVLPGKSGNVWFGTASGLFCFNSTDNTFKSVVKSFDTSNSMSINTAKPLFEDAEGAIWFGTFGLGMYKVEASGERITKYSYNSSDPESLSENAINCIYQDRAGTMWFGTFGAGISVFDPLAHKFALITHDPLNDNSLSSNFIWSVFEAKDDNIWIGTNNKGLNVYSPTTGRFTFYDHDENNPASLAATSVRKVYQDSKGTIWVGTDGGGLDKFNPESGTFTHYKSKPDDPTTISNNSVRVIYEDQTGTYWVGTRNGLNRFNPETGKFKRYLHNPEDPNSISHNFVYSALYRDKEDNLWIGTYGGGLNKMDILNETFTSYLHQSDERESLSDNIVFSIFEDGNGIFWIGTNSGLNRFDPVTEKFSHFGTGEGLPNEVVYGILPDDQNNIWLSTNLGISKFNVSNFSTRNFDVSDGLQSNEFNGGARHKGFSGKLYFGGVYGLNILDPKKVETSNNTSNVVITKLDILGKEVHVASPSVEADEKLEQNKVLEAGEVFLFGRDIAFADEIKLEYKQRFLGFEFAALNTPPSAKINYRYKMENMDDSWNHSGSRNYVTYANMQPGSYVFKVDVKDEHGVSAQKMAELRISIAPPFWLTWWFVLLEIIAVVVLAVFIYVYLLKAKTNRILKRQNQVIQTANEQLTESEQKLKELNATKDKFFSIVAHDLKNPFTSLLSISELLSESYDVMDEEDKITGINSFHRSAKRIYVLLENLLMWSRSQTNRIKYLPAEFDLYQLANENTQLFSLHAEKKGLDLVFISEKGLTVFADREMINMVLRNFLHNAIKYSKAGGEVTLELKQEKQGIEISVKDTGVGMNPEKINNLFNLASKWTTPGTDGEKGTGLGLIVCKEFVERHGSKIHVQSEDGKGSEFGFCLVVKG